MAITSQNLIVFFITIVLATILYPIMTAQITAMNLDADSVEESLWNIVKYMFMFVIIGVGIAQMVMAMKQ